MCYQMHHAHVAYYKEDSLFQFAYSSFMLPFHYVLLFLSLIINTMALCAGNVEVLGFSADDKKVTCEICIPRLCLAGLRSRLHYVCLISSRFCSFIAPQHRWMTC